MRVNVVAVVVAVRCGAVSCAGRACAVALDVRPVDVTCCCCGIMLVACQSESTDRLAALVQLVSDDVPRVSGTATNESRQVTAALSHTTHWIPIACEQKGYLQRLYHNGGQVSTGSAIDAGVTLSRPEIGAQATSRCWQLDVRGALASAVRVAKHIRLIGGHVVKPCVSWPPSRGKQRTTQKAKPNSKRFSDVMELSRRVIY